MPCQQQSLLCFNGYLSIIDLSPMDRADGLKWLDWAKELQFLAQAGLTYSKDVFDIERFKRIREIAAEILLCLKINL